MEIRFKANDDTSFKIVSGRGSSVVGFLREDARSARPYVVVDHIAGLDVERGQTVDEAQKLAREYFGARQFCEEGCGRLTLINEPICRNCAHELDEREKANARLAKALCYVRGPNGDIYKVVLMHDESDARVLVGNLDHWAPTIYRAWEVLDNLNKGIYHLV